MNILLPVAPYILTVLLFSLNAKKRGPPFYLELLELHNPIFIQDTDRT